MKNRSDISRQSSSGFTILEILLAVLIAAILTTMGVVLFRGFKSQKALEESFSQLEVCARTAYAGVLRDQRPWMVVFEKNRCATYSVGGLPPEGVEMPSPVYQMEFKEGQTLLMKRTTWPDWKEIVIPEIWRFEPRSILEPIQVRIESPKGWIQGRYDPLTARIVEVEMEAE